MCLKETKLQDYLVAAGLQLQTIKQHLANHLNGIFQKYLHFLLIDKSKSLQGILIRKTKVCGSIISKLSRAVVFNHWDAYRCRDLKDVVTGHKNVNFTLFHKPGQNCSWAC